MYELFSDHGEDLALLSAGALVARFSTPAFEHAAGCGGELQDAPMRGRGCRVMLLGVPEGQGCSWTCRPGLMCASIGRVRREKSGYGRAVRCLWTPMTAVNRLEILMLVHKFFWGKKCQASSHSCRSPLGPSLSWSK